MFRCILGFWRDICSHQGNVFCNEVSLLCLCLSNPSSCFFSILPPDAAGEHAALHRQRSLPHRPPVIPLVARMADQNTSGTPAMTEREASRLDKFKQLLAGPNTDLGMRYASNIYHVFPTLHSFCLLLPFFFFFLFVLRALARLHFLALFCFSLLVCSFSICQLCRAFNDAVRGKVIEPSGHADYKEKKKYQQQQKQMTGLCSNQTTGLYCLSNPWDFVCYRCYPSGHEILVDISLCSWLFVLCN